MAIIALLAPVDLSRQFLRPADADAAPSHNVKFLRSLAEEQDRRLAEAFPRDQHRERAWFNTLNDAYVEARYSKHFEISEQASFMIA